MQDTNSIGDEVESQRETFRSRGVIRLNRLLPLEKVTSAREAVRNRMQLAGLWKNGTWQVGHLRQAPINEGAKFARRLKGCLEFNELVNDEIPQVVGRLLDGQPTFSGTAQNEESEEPDADYRLLRSVDRLETEFGEERWRT